jgi:hypothetical protein
MLQVELGRRRACLGWTASISGAPSRAQPRYWWCGGDNRLVPVSVEEVPLADMPAVLRPLVYRDLFGSGEEQARQVLLEAVVGPRRPGQKPVFPRHGTPGGLGGAGPRLPGSMPRVWNVPARNPAFTGRDRLLVSVRERLLADDRAVVQALQGMGGSARPSSPPSTRTASPGPMTWPGG